jgi:hypothetical protein
MTATEPSKQREVQGGAKAMDLSSIAGDGLWFLGRLLKVIANRELAILGAA